MLDRVRPLVEARTTMVPRGTTRIVRATLGNDAGAIGAATAAMRGGLIARAAAAASSQNVASRPAPFAVSGGVSVPTVRPPYYEL